MLRVLSCNLQNGDCNKTALAALILELGVDIVALQECPPEIKLNLPSGWNNVQEGELAVFSRHAIRPGKSVKGLHPPHRWRRFCLLPCIVSTPSGEVAFNTVHLPSPRYGLQHILDRNTGLSLKRSDLLEKETFNRMQVSQEVQRAVSSQSFPVIIAGDFNMPDESRIYRSLWNEYANAFSSVGHGYGWSERASVRGIPVRVRVDHILTGNGLKPLLCMIGKDVESDHLPIIADLTMVSR